MSISAKKLNSEPYFYLGPAILLILLVYLYPLIEVFRESFLDIRKWPGTFIGLRNFKIVFTDRMFYLSLLHNIEFLLIIPVIIIIALIIAVILHEKIFGAKFYQSVLFLPYIIPLVAVGIAFSFFFQYRGGLNQMLELLGLKFLIKDWIGNPQLALPVVATAIIWRELGFAIILFLARLGSISEDVVEASHIDGAGWWTRLWRIYVPELTHVIEFYAIISIITMLSQIFGFIFVITNGGPANATWVSELYIYKQAFQFNHLGAGAVMAVILIIMTVAIVIISYRFRSRIGEENG
ncbi:MAG: sugar ABC transporter permease [Actinobacteria bacterium]|nr:sugar ABC transporter permease [Actinomycetota bacterium]